MNTHPLVLLALALVSVSNALEAQGRELVVGKGASDPYAEIADALAVARAGDRILVGKGLYRSFVAKRGVRILAKRGEVTVLSSRVESIPAGELLALRGLAFAESQAPSLGIQSCPGAVVLEDCELNSNAPLPITSARDVRVVRTYCHAAIELRDSHMSVEESDIRAPLSVAHVLNLPGVSAFASTVRISDSSVWASQRPWTYIAPGIQAHTTSKLVIRGASVIASGGTVLMGPAIAGVGEVVYDPGVVLRAIGNVAPIQGMTATRTELPTLRASAVRLGGAQDVAMQDRVGSLGVALLGLPLAPVDVPLLFGAVAQQMQVPLFVTAYPTREVKFQLPLSADRRFLGLALTWQALSGDATRGYKLSNAATAVATDR